jgi:transcriptional regulator with XRE-family HTH domain
LQRRAIIETTGLNVDERANAPQAIGGRLRALMMVTALTVEEIAHLTGTSKGRVVDWLEGRVAPPRGRINRLAKQTGVTLAWVYYGDEGGLLPQTASLLRSALGHNREDPPSGGSPGGPA